MLDIETKFLVSIYYILYFFEPMGFHQIHPTFYKQMRGPDDVDAKYEYFQYIYYYLI